MSDLITLLYKEKEKKIKTPKDYSDLKKLFISSFGEKEKNSYTFNYIDSEEDEIAIEENDEEFESKISYLKKPNTILNVEMIEYLDEINEEEEKNDESMRSAMIFKKNSKESSIQLKELEKKNKELIEINKKLKKEKEETKQRNKKLIDESKEIKQKIQLYEKENNKNIKYEKQIKEIEIKLSEEKKRYEDMEIKIKEDNKKKEKEMIENIKNKENEIINKDNKIIELKQKLDENNKDKEEKEKKIEESKIEIEEYKNKIKNYENEIKNYKSEIEKSKLEVINIKKNNEEKEKEKDKLIEEKLKIKYEEKAKEEIEKMKNSLNKKVKDEYEQLKIEYENNYRKKEKEMEEKLNQMSEMVKLNISILNANQFEHKGIKCQKCFMEPIKGIRYKCSECVDYNLCEKCEEENSNNNFHNEDHEFIKIRKTNEKKVKKEKIYSYDCLNILMLTAYIYEGTEEKEIEIVMKNNGNEKWPKGTKLIFDKSSKIKGDDIILEPQNVGEEKKYLIVLKNMKELKEGQYKAILTFNVDGINHGEKLGLVINIKKKEKKEDNIEKNIDKIKEFRETFNLSEEEYPNEKILGILMENNFNFEDSFTSLFN